MAPRYSFSGHETFPLRLNWLKKAVDAVGKKNTIFHSDTAIVEFGVGRNMVRAIRHWGLATEVIEPDTDSKERNAIRASELGTYLLGEKGPLAILDLSLVPSEAIHVVVSVLARMVFEAVQRHRKLTGYELPTVLVLDEAHTFVHERLTSEISTAAGKTCCRTFERVAREGRKFGLGLVLASQRPSEISPTILSQCNTFFLHRIVNDRDQNLVKRLVPDGLGDLLRELPSLPSRRAILLGWGAPAPLLAEMRELPEAQRPHSPDPMFWDVWTGEKDCAVEWEKVAEAWSPTPQSAEDDSRRNGLLPQEDGYAGDP